MSYVIERDGNSCLIIGQAPARTDDPRHPISGRTGKRLASLMGMSLDFLQGHYDRANLLNWWPGSAQRKGDLWPAMEARVQAIALIEDVLRPDWGSYKFILLLGGGVTTAMGSRMPVFTWQPAYGDLMARIPHPSGISRWWNEAENRGTAGRFLQNLHRACYPTLAGANNA